MRHVMVRWTLAAALGAVAAVPAFCAEEAPKALPTLLIKGEVVSVDMNDPSASLLKVKDRYGFETPIYLTPETKIAQGDQSLTTAGLHQGTAVEVEYNFDINTAKRHAVSVKVTPPAASASAAGIAATPSAAAPATTAPAMPSMPPAPAAASPAPSAPNSAPAAAPAPSAAPASNTPAHSTQ